jgi:hypothetical protein
VAGLGTFGKNKHEHRGARGRAGQGAAENQASPPIASAKSGGRTPPKPGPKNIEASWQTCSFNAGTTPTNIRIHHTQVVCLVITPA